MIFFFSGTGNTRYVAEILASSTNEVLLSIPEELERKETGKLVYELKKDEAIGFIFPVYAWGLPKIVEEFIGNLLFKNYKGHFVFFVCTCGDDIGKTKELFQKAICPLGLSVDSGYSLAMPNCYVSLPGFDVDKEEDRTKKLTAAPKQLREIGKELNARQKGVFRLTPGAFPWIKSYVLRFFFNTFLMDAKPFRTTDACTVCRKCEKVCPLHNIDCSHSAPQWGNRCTGCLACYHHCPQHAIEYGILTRGKGQYLFKSFEQ